MHRSFIVIVCLTVLLTAASAGAQQYHFHTYNEVDGLPSSKVLDIAQDRDGLLWLGTVRGLVTYDGSQWRGASPASRNPNPSVSFIGRDHEDRMWLIDYSPFQRVHVLRNGRWHPIHLAGPEDVEQPYLDFTLGRTSGGATVLAMVDYAGNLKTYCDGEWRQLQLDSESAGVGNMVFAGGRFHFATRLGLYSLDPDTWTVVRTALDLPLNAICRAAKDGGLWLVGDDWLGIGTADEFQVVVADLPLAFSMPAGGTSAIADPSGGIYFGDWGQVHFYHPRHGLEALTRESGLPSLGVTSFLLDREGHVWLGGQRGLSKLVNRRFARYDTRQGLPDDEVSSILVRANGQVVLGHLGALTYFDDPPRSVTFGDGNQIHNRISDMAESPTGEIWFAADRLGLGRVNGDDSVTFFGTEDGVPESVYAVDFDRDGRLWVGCNKGVVRRENGRFIKSGIEQFVGTDTILIRRLLFMADGALLVGSGHYGLFRWRDGEVTHFSVPRGDAGNQVYNMFETGAGDVLVGSVSGLYELKDEKLQKAAAPWPAIDRPIYAFAEDGAGCFWFGTDNGVLCWDGTNLTHLTNRDGLLGSETNRDAIVVGPGGDLWIGTDRGLSIYHADFDQDPLAPPLVSLLGYEADGVSFPASEPLKLTAPVRNLEVFFQGLAFRDERRNTFLTLLQGFEEHWQGPQKLEQGLVRYTNVPPGTYRFHVRVQGADGTTSPVTISEKIEVRPPLMRRAWFIVVVVLLGLAAVWLLASTFLKRRHAVRLQQAVKERTAELELSERRLRAESRRLGATLESISDGVITLDSRHRVVMCNVATERMLGQSQDQLLGHDLYDILHVEPRVPLTPGAPTVHAHYDLRGRQSWFEFSVAPIPDPELGEVGAVLAFRDITGRREMENQRARAQQLESLGVLAGGIAHDFNNLLTVVLGNISLVEEAESIGPMERGQLNKVKAASENARALTEQFLTFAKGGDPDLVPTALDQIVRQAATLVFSGASVSCQLDLAQDLKYVMVDRGQISQVLSNLFLNACQAMTQGGAVVIRARNAADERDESGAGWIVLEVQDEGEGIAKDKLDRVFDPYYTTKEHGTGLGLAIAHSIIRRHGGRLSVESEPGHGSVFSLALPATDAMPAEVRPAKPVLPLPPARILVLDDEKDVLDVYGRLLEGLGLSCVVTTDGLQTVRMFASAQQAGVGFDAVIMDLTVPGGMGGKDAVQEVLAIDPRAKVIVSSGYSHDPVMANCRQFGFQAALRKPFDLVALRRILQQVLEAD